MVGYRIYLRYLCASGHPFKDLIPGGLAKGRKPEDFDPETLAKGIKVEMEHTTDENFAREIAMDHLTEDPEYYDKLEAIEKKAMSYSYERTAGYPGPLAPLAKKAQQATMEELKAVQAIQQAINAWKAIHQQNYQNAWKPLREAMEKADRRWYDSPWANENIGSDTRGALDYGIGGFYTRDFQEGLKATEDQLKGIERSAGYVVDQLAAVAQWQETDRNPKR